MPVAVPLIAAGVGAAGAIASSKSQSNAAKNAANVSQQATDATIAEQRRQFDIAQRNQQPWLTTGTNALNQLASLYGLSSSVAPQQGTNQAFNEAGNPVSMNAFVASPDYQFRQDEQGRALTARNAMLGIQDSGAAQKAALQYSGNLASGEFNNYANRLASLAGVGQSAANQSAAQGANFANNMGSVLGNNAQNLASSYATQGAANGQMWGQLAGIGSGLIGKIF